MCGVVEWCVSIVIAYINADSCGKLLKWIEKEGSQTSLKKVLRLFQVGVDSCSPQPPLKVKLIQTLNGCEDNCELTLHEASKLASNTHYTPVVLDMQHPSWWWWLGPSCFSILLGKQVKVFLEELKGKDGQESMHVEQRWGPKPKWKRENSLSSHPCKV